MAVLGKIRQRSIFLILVIGMALFAFVISITQLGFLEKILSGLETPILVSIFVLFGIKVMNLKSNISYIETPIDIRDKYQYFTVGFRRFFTIFINCLRCTEILQECFQNHPWKPPRPPKTLPRDSQDAP